MTDFMFATGIENSNPTIDQGRTRVDEMDACRHYQSWREDFALIDCIGENGEAAPDPNMVQPTP